MKTPTWYRVLLAARTLGREFTGKELARAAKIPLDHGSAWAAKCVGWGYFRRVALLGQPAGGPGRPQVAFNVTRAGKIRRPPETVRGTRTSQRSREE